MNEGLKQLGLIVLGVALTVGFLTFHAQSVRMDKLERMHNNLVKILVEKEKAGQQMQLQAKEEVKPVKKGK